jgi:hypothetical protein
VKVVPLRMELPIDEAADAIGWRGMICGHTLPQAPFRSDPRSTSTGSTLPKSLSGTTGVMRSNRRRWRS